MLSAADLATSEGKILENLRSQLSLKELEIENYTRFVKIEDPTVVRMKSERENLVKQIAKIEEGYANPDGTLVPARQDLPNLALRFGNLSDALQVQKSIYQSLSQQYELVKLYLQSEPVFQVLEPPEVPDVKSGPARATICLVATVLAVAFGAVLAFAVNSLNALRSNAGLMRLRSKPR